MKVNTALLMDEVTEKPVKKPKRGRTKPAYEDRAVITDFPVLDKVPDDTEDTDVEADIIEMQETEETLNVVEPPEVVDESDRHPKFKALLLIAAMMGGFVLCVWNMTGLVNNMRLDSQGQAVNIVSEAEDITNFMGDENRTGPSDSTSPAKDDIMESEVSMDAARDGPGSGDSETALPDNEAGAMNNKPADMADNKDMAALRKEVEDAKNEAALVRQELKNAEDMLDSSLAREAELQSQLDALKGNH